jgi:hypothetical protein
MPNSLGNFCVLVHTPLGFVIVVPLEVLENFQQVEEAHNFVVNGTTHWIVADANVDLVVIQKLRAISSVQVILI